MMKRVRSPNVYSDQVEITVVLKPSRAAAKKMSTPILVAEVNSVH